MTTAAITKALGPTLRVLGEPADNLAEFMRRYGHLPEAIVAQVATLFGELDLVLASGSVVIGYANAKSDVDLYAVGDVPDTQQVPVVSHELGPLLDITLVQRGELSREFAELRDTPAVLAAGGPPAAKWRAGARAMDRAARCAYGVALHATGPEADIQRSLRAGWLVDRAVTWWALDTRRRLLAARWLEPVNPALAAQLACEARLCALKAVTAQAGFVYYNQKFVAKELRTLGREDLLVVYRQALREAWDPTVPVRETTAIVDDLIGAPPSDLVVEAAYARGVATHRVGAGTLVSRWEMRGAWYDGTDLPPARRDGRVIWSGGLDDPPPEWLTDLARFGLVWLGVAHAAH